MPLSLKEVMEKYQTELLQMNTQDIVNFRKELQRLKSEKGRIEKRITILENELERIATQLNNIIQNGVE